MTRKNLKPTLLSMAIAASLAAGVPTTAQALSLGISGQINKQLTQIDNGNDSSLNVLDNTNSGTRFRFTGEEDLGNGLKVGGVWEWQWQNTPSSGVDFNAQGEIVEVPATTLQDRKAEIYFGTNFGQFTIGKGDGAGNGAAEVDLSGTAVIDYASANGDQLGSVNFRDSANATLGTVGAALGSFDMFSRNNRIRYDSPTFAKAFSIAVSRADAGLTEAALWINTSFGSSKLAAAISTGDTGDVSTTETERTALSASLLLGNGLNFTVSRSTNELDTPGSTETTFTYFKVGFKKGKHAVSAAIGDTEFSGPAAGTNDPSSTALAWVYNLAKDVEIYAAWREADQDTAAADDVSSITVGSRIRWK